MLITKASQCRPCKYLAVAALCLATLTHHFLPPDSCRSVYCPCLGSCSSPRHLLEYQDNILSPLRNSLQVRAGGAGHTICPQHVPHMSWTRPLTSLRCPSHVLDTFSHFPYVMALSSSNVKASLVPPWMERPILPPSVIYMDFIRGHLVVCVSSLIILLVVGSLLGNRWWGHHVQIPWPGYTAWILAQLCPPHVQKTEMSLSH